MKLILYIIRWQLSTPILYLVIDKLELPDLQRVIIANLIGALIFFPVDKYIFKIKNKNDNPEISTPNSKDNSCL